MKVQPGERVGAYQCLNCLRIERRMTKQGHHQRADKTLKRLRLRCRRVECRCDPHYFTDGATFIVEDVTP